MGSRRQIDYYLAGRNLPWLTVGISTLATQIGAVSFVSVPAFVALKPAGGLVWLSYEFAVPLVMAFHMVTLVPVLHQSGAVSIYGFLEKRYDGTTSALVSFLFQLGRGLATGVSVYV